MDPGGTSLLVGGILGGGVRVFVEFHDFATQLGCVHPFVPINSAGGPCVHPFAPKHDSVFALDQQCRLAGAMRASRRCRAPPSDGGEGRTGPVRRPGGIQVVDGVEDEARPGAAHEIDEPKVATIETGPRRGAGSHKRPESDVS